MLIARRLKSLLRRKGYRVTGAVRAALTELIATLYEENPGLVDGEAADAADGGAADDHADLQVTQRIACPYCGEPVEIAIDLSAGDQDDVQDCTVCCSPIHVTYSVRNRVLGSFQAEPS